MIKGNKNKIRGNNLFGTFSSPENHGLGSCIEEALKMYLQRHEIDTNPQIVEMKFELGPHFHCYYLSEGYFHNPFTILTTIPCVMPYSGPISGVIPALHNSLVYVPFSKDDIEDLLEKNTLKSIKEIGIRF